MQFFREANTRLRVCWNLAATALLSTLDTSSLTAVPLTSGSASSRQDQVAVAELTRFRLLAISSEAGCEGVLVECSADQKSLIDRAEAE